MIKLPRSLQAWNTESFKKVLNEEICSLPADELPLQQGLSYSNYAVGDNLSAIILRTQCDEKYIVAKAGLFYAGIISGCNCADDPTPVNEISEYCEVQFCIDRLSAETTVTLLSSP